METDVWVSWRPVIHISDSGEDRGLSHYLPRRCYIQILGRE